MRPAQWTPPVVWMAAILALSSDLGAAEHTGRVLLPLLRVLLPGADPLQVEAAHRLLRKSAHVAEYAVLGLLWFRALLTAGRRPPAAALVALGVSAAWATLDESVQALTASRTGHPGDVALDAAGAALALSLALAGWRRWLDGVAEALLILAAAGGLGFLAVDLWLDVPAGLLWFTTPAAAAVWLGRRARRRRRPPAA